MRRKKQKKTIILFVMRLFKKIINYFIKYNEKKSRKNTRILY